MKTALSKLINRIILKPRKQGLGDPSIILDQNFGTGRGTPIDRKLINDYLMKRIPKMKENIQVLEFSDSIFAKRYFPNAEIYVFNYVPGKPLSLDKKNLTLSGDLLSENSAKLEMFDVIIATQLLAFTSNPFKAANNLVGLLTSKGVILGTEPFCSPISNYDDQRWGDFFRFTKMGIKSIYSQEPFGIIEVEALGNWDTSYSIFKGFCLEDNLSLSHIIDDGRATNIGYRYVKSEIL